VSGKCFTSYEDQIEILKSRGLTFSDHQKAIEILSFENYYSLINGYKDLFLATTGPVETYKVDASLSEIYALYRFDEELKA
jgi:abortive infection bacteriophage resistance protein